jgi:hypothetical protein
VLSGGITSSNWNSLFWVSEGRERAVESRTNVCSRTSTMLPSTGRTLGARPRDRSVEVNGRTRQTLRGHGKGGGEGAHAGGKGEAGDREWGEDHTSDGGRKGERQVQEAALGGVGEEKACEKPSE